eukprot:2144850-Alexandrium_andersonii.AAC.1
MFERMGASRVADLRPAVACLALEALLAGWPQRDVSRILAGIPRRHGSPFFSMARAMGTRLRHDGAVAYLRPFADMYASLDGSA